MIFKRLSFENVQFDDSNVEDIKAHVEQGIKKESFPMGDLIVKREQGIQRFHR